MSTREKRNQKKRIREEAPTILRRIQEKVARCLERTVRFLKTDRNGWFAAVALVLAALTLFGLCDTFCGRIASIGKMATIDGHTITRRDVNARLAGMKAQNPTLYDAKVSSLSAREIDRLLTEQLIDEHLIAQECQRRGIVVTDGEVSAQYQTRMDALAFDADLFKELKRKPVVAAMRAEIRADLLRQRLLAELVPSANITEKEVAQLLEQDPTLAAQYQNDPNYLHTYLLSQRRTVAFEELIARLRSEATIIHLNP